MDFRAIQLFLFLYFIRPQDWVPGIAGARLVFLNMAAAMVFTILRPGGFSLKSLLKTPQDWMMLAYFCWVVFTAPEPVDTFQDCKSLYIFYVVTVLALSSWERMGRILSWWTVLLLIVAGLAVGSLFGMDITGAAGITFSQKGRLSLNTWMLNNPNALGHTVIAAIPLTYFALIWRRNTTTSRLLAPAWIVLAGYCVYETQSKGAFLIGAATLAASQIFGRPRIVQVMILVLALTAGSALVKQLPRMQSLSRSDEGIQARLAAWQNGRDTIKEHPMGVGWKNFVARFRLNKEWIEMAAHGSYVQIGASLGYGGLFLYLGVLYCGFRTLIQARTRTADEERVRRMLFCLLFSYTFSNWMIDRAYHTEFFIIAAAIGAFHRLCLAKESVTEEIEEPVDGFLRPAGHPVIGINQIVDARSLSHVLATVIPTQPHSGLSMGYEEAAEPQEVEPQLNWTRIGIVDLALTALLLRGVLAAWDYILKNF